MIERYPSLRKVAPVTALSAVLLTACGTEQAPPQERPDPTPSITKTEEVQPPKPNPTETGAQLQQKELRDGTPALVCNALAAILNPDKTRRIIAQPIVWNDNKAPVEIINMSPSGIVVEERQKMPMEWYSLDGQKTDEKDVDCKPHIIYAAYNQANNNQIVATVPEVGTGFKADYRHVHNGELVQHDFGPYNQVETDELLQQLRSLG